MRGPEDLSWRRKIQIDDLDDAPIAEAAEEQCAAFKQHRRLLRAKKLAAKTDERVPVGRAGGGNDRNKRQVPGYGPRSGDDSAGRESIGPLPARRDQWFSDEPGEAHSGSLG